MAYRHKTFSWLYKTQIKFLESWGNILSLSKHISYTLTHILIRSCFRIFTLILIVCPFTIYELHVTMIKGVYSLECIQWTSSRDGKYRSHCYEYFQGTENSTFEAEAACKIAGGQLAPFVDEFQYNFWRRFLPTPRYRVLKINLLRNYE